MSDARERGRGPVQDELTVIPPNLKLRLERCPSCGYERQSGDTEYFSPYECPRCGKLYAASMEDVQRMNKGQELMAEAELDTLRQQQSSAANRHAGASQAGGAMFVARQRSQAGILALVAILVAALLLYLYW